MEIKGSQHIGAPRQRVWDALNDPEVLKQCLPGCESVERVSPEEFSVTVAAAIGPLRARFKGKLLLTEAHPPASCVMLFEGQGGAIGFGKGSSTVSLSETPEGTELSYVAKAQVGGKLAQVGSRLIDSVAKKMSDDFFKAFKQQLTPADEPAPARKAAAPVAPVADAAPVAVAADRSVMAPVIPTAKPPASTVHLVPAWWLGVATALGALATVAGAIAVR